MYQLQLLLSALINVKQTQQYYFHYTFNYLVVVVDKWRTRSEITYTKTYTRDNVFVRIFPFSRHSSDRSYLSLWITPYQTSLTSHYDNRSLVLLRDRINTCAMFIKCLEELKLNGFKQDLCCREEERGQKANRKTKTLTACKMGPCVGLTQLSFLFWTKGRKRSNQRLNPSWTLQTRTD
jgi:hypothetical protein